PAGIDRRDHDRTACAVLRRGGRAVLRVRVTRGGLAGAVLRVGRPAVEVGVLRGRLVLSDLTVGGAVLLGRPLRCVVGRSGGVLLGAVVRSLILPGLVATGLGVSSLIVLRGLINDRGVHR